MALPKKSFEFTLDLMTEPSIKPIVISQHDINSVEFVINLKKEGATIDLTGADVRFVALKTGDATRVIQSNTDDPTTPSISFVSEDVGIIKVNLLSQTFAAIGTVYAEVEIEENGSSVVTRRFSFIVTAALGNDAALQSTNFFPAIQKAIEAGTTLANVDLQAIVNNTNALNAATAEIAAAREGFANVDARLDDITTDIAAAKAEADTNATNITALQTEVGAEVLTTTAQNVKGAVNEVKTVTDNNANQIGIQQQSITTLQTGKVDKVAGKDLSTNDYNNTEKAEVAKVVLKADKTYVDSQVQNMSSQVQGFFPTVAALTSAIPAGNTNNYVVQGNIPEVDTLNVTAAPTASGNVTVTLNGVSTNIAVTIGVKEVASLTVTAIPTVAGNVTVTLNGVATTIAVDPATDTTTDAIATKIRNTVYSTGSVTGGTGSIVTFTAPVVGARTDATYSAGTTGATGTMSTTTQGVDADTATSVATKIRGTAFSGWTVGGSGTTVIFTANVGGAKTAPAYSAGSTGSTGAISVTTIGVNADNTIYRWNGSAWASTGYLFNSTGIADKSVTLNSASDDLKKYISNSWLGTTPIFQYPVLTATTQANQTKAYIINSPVNKSTITKISANTFGTNLKVYVMRKNSLDSTFTVLSKTTVTTTVGVGSYDVLIDIPEDGLYLAVEGSMYYQITGAIGFYDVASTNLSVNSSYTGTLSAASIYLSLSFYGLTEVFTGYDLRNANKTVKDYGAKGDNIADDTIAAQNMINDVGYLTLPSGTFLLDSVLLKSKTKITGAGKGLTTVKFITNHSHLPMFDARGVSGALKDTIEITGISFTHDPAYVRPADKPYGGVFIALDYTKFCEVHDNEFYNFNSYAIYAKMIDGNITEARSDSIHHNIFRDGGTSAIGVFLDQEAEYAHIMNNQFHTIPNAIKLYQAANDKIQDNTFLKCGSSITAVIDITCPAQNSGKTFIQGNTANHNLGDVVKITATYGTGQHGCHITDNEFLITPAGYVPIRILGSKGCLVSINRLWAGHPNDPGVFLADNGAQIADYNMIINNMMLNSSLVAVTNNSTGVNNVVSGNIMNVPI